MDGNTQEWLKWQQDYAQWEAQYGKQYEMMQQNMGQMPYQGNDLGFQQRGGRGGRGDGNRGGRGRGGQQQQNWSPGRGPTQRSRAWSNNSPRRGGANNQGQWGGNNQQNDNSWQKQQNNDGSWGNQLQQQQQWGGPASRVDNQPQQQFSPRGRGRGAARGRGFGKQQEWSGPGAPVVPPVVQQQTMLELSKHPPPPPPPQEDAPKPPIPSLMETVVQQPAVEHKEEMSEAEKEFDLQFKNWEDQFNNWKEENKQHPDRQQYEEYERKMEKFREQLLSRREQMRKKREAETKLNQHVAPVAPLVNPELAAFTANWEKGPPEDPKPKPKSIQETLKQMANYTSPTGDKPSGIPGLDVDATVKEDNLQPPGTEPVESPKPVVPNKEAPSPSFPQAGCAIPTNNVNQANQGSNQFSPELMGRSQSGPMAGNQSSPMSGNQHGPMVGNQPGPMSGPQYSPLAGNQHGPMGVMAGNQPVPMTGNQHGPMGSNQPGPKSGHQYSPMSGNQHGPMGAMTGNQPVPMTGNQHDPMGGNQNGPMGSSQPGTMSGNQHSLMAGNQHRPMGPMGGNQVSPMGRNQFGPMGGNQLSPMGRNQPGSMGGNMPRFPHNAPFRPNNYQQEQNFYEDEFMDDSQFDDSQEMTAMHERFSEDCDDGWQNGGSQVEEVAGNLPPDFNPWIDLGSDDELPPYMYDNNMRGPPPLERQQWQGSQGNFQNQGPPRGDFGPQQNAGPRPFEQNQRWNEFRGRDADIRRTDVDDRARDVDDRGRDVDDRVVPQGGNRGPYNTYHEEMGRPDQRPGHWQDRGPPPPVRAEVKVEEYKAKTVIEYDHKEMNVMTPAMTPATPPEGTKKKRVFKAPVKIYDYGHSAENEPIIKTPDPFEYDRSRYVKWEEEERRRQERERERDRWFQEDRRRYSRQRDWDRGGRERDERSDYRPDRERNRNRSRDRSEHRYREERPERTHDDRENTPDSRQERLSPPPKHSRSRQSNESNTANQGKNGAPPNKIFNIPDEAENLSIEELLCLPGRVQRPSKFAIFMRGLPGSGKSHVAKLIKDKEVENGGNAPRILSLDDYFMVEAETEIQDAETNRKIKTKEMKYEYEAEMEDAYRQSLVKAFRKTVDEGFFPIIMVDCVNDKVKHFEEMWLYASSKGFKTYVAELPEEASVCAERTEHGRTLQQIEQIAAEWEATPPGFAKLDVKVLLNKKATTNEVQTEGKSDNEDGTEDIEADDQFSAHVELPSSKWDAVDTEDKLDKLDGIKKRPANREATTSMEDWLGFEEMDNAPLEPGKKRVRWADVVERKEQEKMRAIGFVVGQTDWSRMMDPTFGGGALTKTKYI